MRSFPQQQIWIIQWCNQTTKPPFTLFCNKDAKYMKHLRSFREMAVVAIHEGKKMRSKLDNRGKTCMFVDMQMIILEMYTDF